MIYYVLFVGCFLIWGLSFKCIKKRMTDLKSITGLYCGDLPVLRSQVRDQEFIAVYGKPSVKGIYRECADRINRGSTRISPETIGDLTTTPISMDLLPP